MEVAGMDFIIYPEYMQEVKENINLLIVNEELGFAASDVTILNNILDSISIKSYAYSPPDSIKEKVSRMLNAISFHAEDNNLTLYHDV